MVTLATFTVAIPASAQSYTFITDFTKTGNMQNELQASFPSGAFTANNSFATPFHIEPDSNGNNYDVIGTGTTLTINVGAYGVSDVYTLLNAFNPDPDAQIASVEFLGSGGADQTFLLTSGIQIRDFYQGQYANSLNGTTSQNAFSVVGPGGAGTGNVSTGLYGTYVMDEQDFHLDDLFLTQSLDSIKITNIGSGLNRPILFGVTTSSPVPETSTTVSFGLLLVLGGFVFAARRKKGISQL